MGPMGPVGPMGPMGPVGPIGPIAPFRPGPGPMGPGYGPVSTVPNIPNIPNIPNGPNVPTAQWAPTPPASREPLQPTPTPIQQRHQSLPAVMEQRGRGFYSHSPRAQRRFSGTTAPSFRPVESAGQDLLGAAAAAARAPAHTSMPAATSRHSAPPPPRVTHSPPAAAASRARLAPESAAQPHAAQRSLSGRSAYPTRSQAPHDGLMPSSQVGAAEPVQFDREKLPRKLRDHSEFSRTREQPKQPVHPSETASPSHKRGPREKPPRWSRASSENMVNIPPGSASSRSLWNFGKARSMARGYEAVPRPIPGHGQGASGEVDLRDAEAALAASPPGRLMGGAGAGAGVEAGGVWDEDGNERRTGEKRWSGLGVFGRGHRSEARSPRSVKSGRSQPRWWSAGERQSEREAFVGV